MQSEGSWTDPVPVDPLQIYKISKGTAGVAFYGVNDKGKAVIIPTFDFDMTFAGSGQVQAELSDGALITSRAVRDHARAKALLKTPQP
jgi:hypothetical protein